MPLYPTNNPPAISRYNALITFNSTDWIREEQFNTLGTLGFNGATDDQPIFTSAGNLFTENRTIVKCTPIKAAGDQNIQVLSMTDGTITLFAQETPAAGDSILVEIEVINI